MVHMVHVAQVLRPLLENMLDSESLIKTEPLTIEPEPIICTCGNPIRPVWLDDAPFHYPKKNWHWEFQNSTCPQCLELKSNNVLAEEELRGDSGKIDDWFDLFQGSVFPVHRSMMLSNLTPTLKSIYKEVVAGFLKGKNIFFHGSVGSGKTHLGMVLSRKFIVENNRSSAFYRTVDLCKELREESWEGDGELIIDNLLRNGSIFFDDLAVERQTPFVAEKFYDIFDRLWLEQKEGLIITSNKSLDEIAEKLDDRIASRISALCEIVKLPGRDHRLGIRKT